MDGSTQNGSSGVKSSGEMSRREIFEDEKRRIIESCFSKRDEADQTLIESYITHIRIIEDSSYPSSPPPPSSNSSAKKARVIIVAVRKSGRVRILKARENGNGTFSVGKMWPLDDLQGIQSYGGGVAASFEEEQQKQWAGETGFTVMLGKPYYWQANAKQEKQFFIASLVKIYTKYTGGKMPELIGFDARERDQVMGVTAPARPPPSSLQSGSPGPAYGQPQNRPPRREPSRDVSIGSSREGSRELRSQPSRDAMQRPQPQVSSYGQASRPPVRSQRGESPASSMDSTGFTPQPSQASLRRLAGSNQSQDSFPKTDDDSGLPPRSRGGLNGVPSATGRFQDRSVTPNSQRALTPESSFPNGRDVTDDIPPVPAPLAIPPERRRPPMPNVGDSRQRKQNSVENIVPAPLSSPGMRRDDFKVPNRSAERPQTRDREPSLNMTTAPATTASSDDSRPPPFRTNEVNQTEATPPSTSAVPLESPQSSMTSPAPNMPDEPEEEMRPGLGPMIKKKSKGDIAGQFLRAAKTHNTLNSFKPRAGGAAERLREAQAKSPDGPDGITSVVPAPSLTRTTSSEPTIMSPASATFDKTSTKPSADDIPEVKITVSQPARPNNVEVPSTTPQDGKLLPEMPKPREVKRVKSPAESMAKELASIGVDPNVLGGRGGELIAAWDEFGWVGEGIRTKNIDQMKEEIERELNKIQAGGWLNRLEEEDERIEAIKAGFDSVIEECDELDGLLTLYLVELSTLNEDVAYIEAQSQGLQVQTANQKLLQTELKSLLQTISISSEQLDSLREASLESPRGLKDIENALVMLFKAMLTIDPSLSLSGLRASEDGSFRSGKPGGYGNSEIGSMRVLQEKKDVYKNEIGFFLGRLRPFLQVKFAAAIDETRQALERERGLARSPGKAKLDYGNHDLARVVLWKYSPLMLFTREVDRTEWEALLKMYENVCRPLYQDEFRDSVFAWKRIAKKLSADDCDFLFTTQVEKHTEGLGTTARKLTIKRSGTLAKSLRSPAGDNSSKSIDGRQEPFEVFDEALSQMVSIMSMEQNFIVDFFHITSLEQHDFPESVALAIPEERRGTDVKRLRKMEPDRDLAKMVVESMEEVYSFFMKDMQALIEWSLQVDPLQGVGVIAAIERKILEFGESSQEYLSRTLQKLHTMLIGLFTKFLDDQIRAIEDTKVKIKKRKGIITFIKVFPAFSNALEKKLVNAHDLEIRGTVNNAYSRLNKAMFESLKVIARENPGAQISGADPEDKEALNYQILLMQNMNYYLEEVDIRSNPVLEEWSENAAQEWEEHMSLYLGAVIRRPLGKLLDFLESTESLMVSRQPGDPISKISSMPSHSKITFKKILASYDSKEIRRGIDTLKKRVEKHFGDEHDPGMSTGGLVAKVLQRCEQYYEKVEDRILTIGRDVYDNEVIAEWTRADVSSAFKK